MEAADELERRLADVDVLRRRVLNVIPHALRTPITTCRGLAEAIATASEDEIRREIAPALRRITALAEKLLDDMLLAAGVTTTLPTAPPAPVAVTATATRLWDDVGAPRQLRVEGDDAVVLVPDGTLEKILGHVFDNAAKYGADPTVLRITPHNGHAMVRIAVESPGAEVVDDVGLVTEPFFRGERAVTQAAGLGVGLPVARALAVHAGGGLDVVRGDGGGLVVTVELPSA
jgi:signal transduction histidine kinase